MATSSPSTALTFLDLPAEIRQLIYSHLLCNPVRACILGLGNATWYPNILKVCHQVYEEAIPLFYALNTFNLGKDPGRAREFFANSTTQNLACVRHLEVFSFYNHCHSCHGYDLFSYNHGHHDGKIFAKELCDLTRRAANIKTFTMSLSSSLCHDQPFDRDTTKFTQVFAESHPTLKRAISLRLPAKSEHHLHITLMFVTEEYALKPGENWVDFDAKSIFGDI